MKKSDFHKLMQDGAEVLVNRDRCSVNGKTVRRAFVDDLMDSDLLVCTGKSNNFTRAYKMKIRWYANPAAI